MWLTAVHLLQWPAAIVCGYALSRAAGRHGLSVWLAYAAALAAGVTLALLSGPLAATNQHPWNGFLIWAAWAAFGIVQGRSRQHRRTSLTTLNLSGLPR